VVYIKYWGHVRRLLFWPSGETSYTCTTVPLTHVRLILFLGEAMKDDIEKARRRLARLPVQAKIGRPAGLGPSKADLLRLYVTAGLSVRATGRA